MLIGQTLHQSDTEGTVSISFKTIALSAFQVGLTALALSKNERYCSDLIVAQLSNDVHL